MADSAIPEELHYSREDEWARVEDGRVVVGITDYAQDQLGDITYLELPELGARVERGAAFGVIESVKTASDLFAPVSGEVVARNEDLADRPELVNEDCYGDGWIVAIACDPEKAAEGLLDAAGYRQHIAERSE